MSGRCLICLIVFYSLCGSAAPVEGTVKGKGAFQLDVDAARFYGDSTKTYVEIYYDILENILTYKPDSGRFLGAVNMKLELRNDTSVVSKKEWTVPHMIADTSRLIAGQKLVGIEGLALPRGSYVFSLSAYDVCDPSRRDSLSAPLQLQPFPGDRETLSDVEFCTSIQASTNKQSMYYKNTLEVIPNASRLYGVGLPIIYYYAEAYNLMMSQSPAGLIVHAAAIDANGREVVAHDKPKSRAHNSSVEVGTLNISALRGGTYYFRISLLDSARKVLAVAAKKFFVYRPGSTSDSSMPFASADVSTSIYAMMTDSALDREFSYARYIASDLEQKQYALLTERKAKQRFVFEFWRRRDPDPLTPGNEYQQEYFRRAEYANKNLTYGLREGWKTDRGRVYIVYGTSDEVERFPSSSQSLPYEIWHYNNIQGGVVFVFVDRTGMGDYQLVHSTHRDELHDEMWYDRYAQRMH
ncbi:MAG TPA: GWxTD domain-containing protein [Bacteroidota bacterium]|nr:GWxTD domain-containing protein [Bacteroidota bacterium]